VAVITSTFATSKPDTRPRRSGGGSVWAGVSLLAMLLAPSDAVAQARTVLNRSFETPVLTQDWLGFPDTSVPGWMSPDGVIEIWRSGFNGVSSISGNQFAEANANSPSGFWQDVCLVSGELVPWRFYHRGRSAVDSMQVTLDGVEIARVGTSPAAWVEYSGTFVAPATGVARVQFTPLNPGSLGNFVDDLIFELTPHVEVGPDASVPEATGTGAILLVSGSLETPQSVDIVITGGSAQAGADYSATTTVTLPAGIYDGTPATGVPLQLGVQNDGDGEGDETITYELANPSAGIRLAAANAAACGSPARTASTITITDDDEADLEVEKTGDTTVEANVDETYTLTVSNEGPSDVTAYVLSDVLPPGATFVSATRGGTESGGVVTWPAIALADGDDLQDEVTIRFTSAGIFDQSAFVSSAAPDPDAGNNQDVLSVEVCGGAIAVVSTMQELRDAVEDDCVSVIRVTPGTYTFGGGDEELRPTADKLIENAGGGIARVDANRQERVFLIPDDVDVTIDGLEITGGRTVGGADGGGILVDGGLTIRNSLLFGNESADDGGAIFQANGSSLLMVNVTVTGNSAGDRGAGVHVRSGAVLRHVTIAGNTSGGDGAGVSRSGGGAGPILENVIVADNTGPGGQIRSAIVSQGVNLVEGGCSGCRAGVDLTGDPSLGVLGLNGGPSRSLPLQASSVAIDRASNVVAVDQRGVPRPQGSSSDIGAYEAPPAVVRGVDVTPDGLASPIERATGSGYTQLFTVENTGDEVEDIDLSASVSPGGGAPFVTIESISAPSGSAPGSSMTLPGVVAGASVDVTISYSVDPTTVGSIDDLELLAALASDPGFSDTGSVEIEYTCGPATVTVSTLAELRTAVADPCVSLIRITPGFYDLGADGQGAIVVDRTLGFENTGGGAVRLDGGGTQRVFLIEPTGDASLTGLTIQNGFAPVDGGGIQVEGGVLTLVSSLVTDNRAGDDGAGLENSGGTVVILNSTFSGNQSDDDGGAFQSEGGTVTLTHVTIVGNRAGEAGEETGGAFKALGGAVVNLNNSILSNNLQGGGTLVDGAGGTVNSNGGNLVDAPVCAFCEPGDLVNVAPGLLPLAFNGGDTQTHGLVNGSPALDAAQNEGVLVDQRGVARPDGTGFDIGAFERISSQDISVTPDGLPAPRVRSAGIGFTEDFTIQNLSSTAEVIELFGFVSGPQGGTPFVTFQSMSGSGLTGQNPSVTGSVPAMGSVTFQVSYDVASGVLGQIDTLRVQGRLASNNAVVDFGQVEIEYFCSGAGSTTVSTVAALRQAVANDCVGTIGVQPGTYDLTTSGSGELVIDRDLTIFNTGGGPAILDAGGASRVVNVTASGNADITGLTLTGGQSGGARGGGLAVSGTALVRSTAIIGNATTNDGGGVAVPPGGFLRIENSTVAGNTATDRGAGFDLEGTAELVHVTIAENIANGVAGGINVRGGTTLLQNSIVADNIQSGGPQVVTAGGTLSSNGGNLVEGGYAASTGGDLTADPQLQPRALNGGTTESYAIGALSPALDEAEAAEALGIDQRGVGRPQGAQADIGAYEAVLSPPAVSVTADEASTTRLPSNTDVALYEATFTLTNTGGGAAVYDLVATTDDALVIRIDSIRGPGLTHDGGTRPDSARTASVVASATVTVSVWYGVLDVALGEAATVDLVARDVTAPSSTDSDATTVTVVRPQLGLSKTALVTGDTLPGSLVTYQMTVTNVGSEGATVVAVSDSLPAQVIFQVGSASASLPSGLAATLEFATAPGAWGYSPESEGCGAAAGFDACVRFIRWTLSDTLSAQAGINSGTFEFTSIIR